MLRATELPAENPARHPAVPGRATHEWDTGDRTRNWGMEWRRQGGALRCPTTPQEVTLDVVATQRRYGSEDP